MAVLINVGDNVPLALIKDAMILVGAGLEGGYGTTMMDGHALLMDAGSINDECWCFGSSMCIALERPVAVLLIDEELLLY